jgi:putative ABC transport system permease protein
VKIAVQPLGFDTHNVYVTDVALPLARYSNVGEQSRFADALLVQLRTLPSVRAAAVAVSWPFQANGLNPIDVEGRATASGQSPNAFNFTIGPNYFDALGIPVFRGREFTDADGPHGTPVAVINDAMARRAFPGVDPIGRRVRIRYPSKSEPAEPWLTVVGVVSNTRSQRYNHIDWDQEAAVYSAFYQRRDSNPAMHRFDAQTLYVYLQARSLASASVAAAVQAVDPDLPLGPLRTTGQIVSELRAQPRLRASILGGLALLTVLLAVVGVYGVMAQFVHLRRSEIAIRVALGAAKSDVIRLVMHRTLTLVIAGLTLGVVGALAAGRILEGTLYGVSSVDPLTFAAVVATLTFVSLVASYVPARSAAGLDPNVTLRCD